MRYNYFKTNLCINFLFVVLFLLFLPSLVTAQPPYLTGVYGGFLTDNNGLVRGGLVVVTQSIVISEFPYQSETVSYKTAVTDENGYYSLEIQCFPNNNWGVSSGAFLENGQLFFNGGFGTNFRCGTYWGYGQSGNVRIFGTASKTNLQNAGPTCSNQSVGEPVNVTNGNLWLQQTDYTLAGIGAGVQISRFYNSILQTSGLFGFGWSSSYDENLGSETSGVIPLRLSSGQIVLFGNMGNNLYKPATADFYGQIVKNTDNTYTLTFKDGRIHKFSSTGKLVWQKDRNGNQTTLNYDANNYLVGITDSFGRTLTVSQNTNGTISQINDSISTVAAYEYYLSTTLLKTVTYNDGSKYKFEYTTVNNKTYLTTIKDALDNILETHQYDSAGRATVSEKAGGVEKYTLDYSRLTDLLPYTTVTDALGRVTKYYFDTSKGRNVIIKTEGVCSCGGSGSEVTQYFYDQKLNLTKKIDALLNETLYTYDSNGNSLTMTDVLGTETSTYNSFGEVLTRTDRMNGVTTNTYNANGNLLTTEDALNNTTTLTYTSLGQLQTVKDARNTTTTFTYDSQGRLTQMKDANNKTTNLGYDARARLTGITNALGQTTNFEYDLNNRLKKVIYADANFITYTYDLAGRKTQAIDALNRTTNYGYDNAYRLTSLTDALNHTTNFGYDLMSNLTVQTDALNNPTNYEYDDFNRLKKIIYPPSVSGATRLEERLEYNTVGRVKKRIDTANRETLYDYDNAHRLIKATDALNQITQFEYNPRSQMTKVKDALNQDYVFTYDALGRQLSQTRAGTTMSYEYDAVGNRKKRTDYIGRVTSYTYDNLNRLTKIDYGEPVGQQASANYVYDDLSRLVSAANEAGTVSFTFDNRNRIKTTTDVFGHLVEYGYDANSNRNLLKFDGANYATHAYDVANRLTTITNVSDNSNIGFGYDNADKLTSRNYPNGVNTTYEYDGMNRLTRLKDVSPTATLFDRQYSYSTANQINQIIEPSQTRSFGYDTIDRLTSVANPTNGNESYVFDAVGNRTSSHRSNTYSYQPFNKLTTTTTGNYNYDANGNMASKAEGSNFWRYGWDYGNHLYSASTRKQTVRYRYDALGRRVQKYFNRGGAGENTKFIYDGQDVLVDDNSGILTKYQNSLGIDNKLRVQAGSSINYFLTDHLGSTNGLADSSGNLTSQTNYDSFGNATNPNFSTRYQFTGREFDNFTNLHYYRTRLYDPNLGRFISEDPIGLGGGINQYAYVSNSPTDKIDPLGLYEIDVHYYLTYSLAKKNGCFSDEFSRQIAEGDQGTDEDESTLPGQGRTFQNSYYHALNDYAQQGVGSPFLLQNVNNSNPKYFGQYLHYLQDTFSHSGYTNTSWGHSPVSWFVDFPFGKYGTHATDKTATDVEKALRMAKSTYAALDGYSQLKCGCNAKPWSQSMEDEVRRFAEVDSLNPNFADIEGDTGLPGIGKRSIFASSGSLGRKISILGLGWR